MNKKLLLIASILAIIGNTSMAANTTTTVIQGKNAYLIKTTDASGNSNYKVNVNNNLYDLDTATFHSRESGVFTGGNSTITGDKMTISNLDNNRDIYITPRNITITNNEFLPYSAESTTLTSGELYVQKIDDSGHNSTTLDHKGLWATNSSTGKSVQFTTVVISAGEQQIHNVAAGTEDTDVVNVSQLREVENKISNIGSNVVNQANHYTDMQVNKSVAKASALAGLQFLDYNPKDKWSFAASVGHYRNANAVAVGAAYQPNENTLIHGGITLDGKVAYNLGISFKTGGQKYINKYELADKVKQLESDNAELRQELNELRSMIEKK